MPVYDLRFAKKQFNRVGLGLFAFLAATFAVEVVVVLIAAIVSPKLMQDPLFIAIAELVASYGAGAAAALLIIRTAPKCTFVPQYKMNFKSILLAFLAVQGLAYVGNLIGTTLMSFSEMIFGKTMENPVDALLGEKGIGTYVTLFMVVVVAPVLEELIFRKAVIDALLPFGAPAAILVSGLGFGLAHGNFFQFFYCALAGLFFAYIYVKTGKIRNTIILHALLNFFGGAIPMLLSDSYEKLTNLLDGDLALDPTFIYESLMEAGPAIIPALIAVMFSVGTSICGIILLIVNRRKFKSVPATLPIPAGERGRTIFLNPGMLLFLTAGAALFIFSMIR